MQHIVVSEPFKNECKNISFFVAVAVAGKSIITKTFFDFNAGWPVVVRAALVFKITWVRYAQVGKNVFPKRQQQQQQGRKKNVKERKKIEKQNKEKSVFHGYMKYI